MPFNRPTLDEINKRIEQGISSRLFGKVALLRFAVLRVLSRVFAGAIHTSYGYIIKAIDQLFVTTATGVWLDRLGKMFKVLRKAGSFAFGQAEFISVIGSTIPKDTRIQDIDGIEYGTVNELLSTTGIDIIDIQAVEAGEAGNYSEPLPGSFQLISPVSGVQSEVGIPFALTGGEDAEEDEPYRKRILQKIQFPPMGGNTTDYEQWAAEVAGVDQAWNYQTFPGVGSTTTVITAVGDNPVPSAVLLTDAQAYIDSVQCVTAVHFTESIEDSFGSPGQATIEFDIALLPNTSAIQDNIRTNLTDLFYPHTPGTDLLINQICSAIMTSGTKDYTMLAIRVDGVPVAVDSDIVLTGFAYPEVGILTFSNQ